MKNQKLLQVLTIGIGFFFLVSGYSKIIDTKAFMVLIANYGLAPLSPLAPFIAGLEIILGLSMVLLISPRKTGAFAFFLLLLFTLAFAYGHFFNGVNDCGCFGNLDTLKTPPVVSFIRNILLMAACCWIWRYYPKEATKIIPWKAIMMLLFGSIAFTTSGMTMVQPLFPRTMQLNTPVKTSKLAGYITTHPDSTYLVFLFKYDCAHCWDASENVKRYQSAGMVDRIIGLGAGTAENRRIYEKQFQPGFEIRNVVEDTLMKMTDAFPTAFIIRHDAIEYVMKEPIHSPFTLNKYYQH